MRSITLINPDGSLGLAFEGSDAEIEMYTNGKDFIEGFYKSSEYFLDDGTPTPKPPKPSESHFWNDADNSWQLDLEALSAAVRRERDRRLAESDWTQLPDVPQPTKDSWAAYRQALRNVPQQAGFPQSIDWPTPPAN